MGHGAKNLPLSLRANGLEGLEKFRALLPELDQAQVLSFEMGEDAWNGPTSFLISHDRRCNPVCPSCRKYFNHTVDESTERDLQRLDDFIEHHRDTL